MKKLLLSSLLAAACGVLSLTGPANIAQANDDACKETCKTKAQSVPANRTANPNIDAASKSNLNQEETPKSKGVGYVVVDNYRGYHVDVYIDRNYRGTVAPYGKAYYAVTSGNTRVYGTSGSYEWGPSVFYLGNNNTFTWELH